MRVLIMHTDNAKLQDSVGVLQKALEQESVKVDLVSPSGAGGSPVSTAPYSLVCVATEYTGWWKPQVPVEMDNLLKRATRLQGKKGVALVQPGPLGSGKALRVLMALMERQGIMVEDFDTLGGEKEIRSIAKRLKRLL